MRRSHHIQLQGGYWSRLSRLLSTILRWSEADGDGESGWSCRLRSPMAAFPYPWFHFLKPMSFFCKHRHSTSPSLFPSRRHLQTQHPILALSASGKRASHLSRFPLNIPRCQTPKPPSFGCKEHHIFTWRGHHTSKRLA